MRPVSHPVWIALRRPLLQLFVIGCAVSLTVSGRLTVRLIAGAMIGWALIPALEISAFAVVRARAGGRDAFAIDLDRFYGSERPWLLWFAAVAAVLAFLTPAQTDAWSESPLVLTIVAVTAIAAAVLAGRLDLIFFRDVFGRSPADARRDLLVQRALVWIPGLVWLFGFVSWPIIADWLHL
jgi:hypothetical protein